VTDAEYIYANVKNIMEIQTQLLWLLLNM